jgi:omega-amidase
MASRFRLALVQMAVSADKDANMRHAVELVEQAARQGAQMVSLPEFCNAAYSLDQCIELAEPIPGPST